MTDREPLQDTTSHHGDTRPDDDFEPLDTSRTNQGEGKGFLKSILTGMAMFPTVPILLAIAIVVIIIAVLVW